MSAPAATKPFDTNPFEALCDHIAKQPDLAQALQTLVDGLAHEVKATSNDQNVQRLARRLRDHAPTLVTAVVGRDVLTG